MRCLNWQIAHEAEGKSGGGEADEATGLQMADPADEGAGDVAEASAAEASSGEAPATSSGEAEPAPSTPAPPAESNDGPKEDWKDKRIARLTAQLHELRETRKQQNEAPANNEPLDPTEDFNRRVADAAAQQVELQRFNDQCNTVAQQGKQVYGEDFQHRVNQLKKLVNESDTREVEQYMGLLRAAIRTGEGHKLLYDLGGDLNKANDILNLDHTSMAIELTKMALAKPPTEEVSNLPRPVRPVGGTTGAQREVDPTDPSRSDNLSTAEWMRRREAQIAAQSRR